MALNFDDILTPIKNIHLDSYNDTPLKMSLDFDDISSTPIKKRLVDSYNESPVKKSKITNDSGYVSLEDLDLSSFDSHNSNPRIKSFIALHNYLSYIKKKNILCSY